jgi:hypothetical protein
MHRMSGFRHTISYSTQQLNVGLHRAANEILTFKEDHSIVFTVKMLPQEVVFLAPW